MLDGKATLAEFSRRSEGAQAKQVVSSSSVYTSVARLTQRPNHPVRPQLGLLAHGLQFLNHLLLLLALGGGLNLVLPIGRSIGQNGRVGAGADREVPLLDQGIELLLGRSRGDGEDPGRNIDH